MKQTVEKQHYVPKFYLKRFANNDNQRSVQILDVKNHRLCKPSSYSAICYDKYFYGLESGVFDETSQEFENMFYNFENGFSKSWCKILTNALNKNLTLQDFETLSWFLSTQLMRTKKFRDNVNLNIANFEKTILQETIKRLDLSNPIFAKAFENCFGNEITEEELQIAKKILLNGEYNLSYNNATFLQHIAKNIEGIKNLFFWQKWKIITSTKNWSFITSDSPVVEWEPKAQDFWGTSFIQRKHYLALTPQILIELQLCSIEEDILPNKSVEYDQATDDEVLMYNFLLAGYSSYAYSTERKEFIEMLDQIKKPSNSIKMYWKNYEI